MDQKQTGSPIDKMAISVQGLESACGSWRVQGTIGLKMPYELADWHKLTIEQTLDYGAVTGQLRFILDASAQPEAALAAYEQLLPKLFPHAQISEVSLTITNLKPQKNRQDTTHNPLLLLTGEALKKERTSVQGTSVQELLLAAASVLVCTGPETQSGQWFLSPYHDVSRIADEALCLAIPYQGHRPTDHYKPHYYQYPITSTPSQP